MHQRLEASGVNGRFEPLGADRVNERHPGFTAGVVGGDGDEAGIAFPVNSDDQHPETGLSVVEALFDRLGRPDMARFERFETFKIIDTRNVLYHRQGAQTERALDFGRDPTPRRCRPQTLLSLVDERRIEPEGSVLGCEPTGSFGDPSFAEDDRLLATCEGLADACPFLEGDAQVTGRSETG